MSTTPISIRLLLYSGSPGDVAIPDAAAVIFALQPSVATPISALVQVETNWGKAKGQTIIGTTLEQRIPMIASEEELNTLADRAFSDPTFNFAAEIGAILARQPDNANVVLEMGRQAARLLERDLRR
jgi:inosine-uridine nucleoside N-ribohydrolase